jgi:hypothetical protein
MLRLQAVNELMPPGAVKNELEQTLEVGDRAIAEGRKTVRDLRSAFTTSDLVEAVRAVAVSRWKGNEQSRAYRDEVAILPAATELSFACEI